MEATRAEVIAAIRRVGGKEDPGGHYNFRVFVDGKFIGKASLSHSWRRLDRARLEKVARQIYLSAEDFYGLITGAKDLAWYREHLKEIGKL